MRPALWAETVLVGLAGETMLVPGIWELEVANAILVGLRRKRLEMPGVEHFLSLIFFFFNRVFL